MKNNLTFEDAMLKLDEAVRRLESGELSLDESITAFEDAVKLIGVCSEKLESAEQKVRMLTQTRDGSITDVDFEIDSDET